MDKLVLSSKMLNVEQLEDTDRVGRERAEPNN